MPGSAENVEVSIDEQVPIINISLGKADKISPRVHDYGGKILATVTNAKHAEAAIGSGADALMITGVVLQRQSHLVLMLSRWDQDSQSQKSLH